MKEEFCLTPIDDEVLNCYFTGCSHDQSMKKLPFRNWLFLAFVQAAVLRGQCPSECYEEVTFSPNPSV